MRIRGQRGCIIIGFLITMAIMAALVPVFAAAILHIKLYLDDPIVEPAQEPQHNYIQGYIRARMPQIQDQYYTSHPMNYRVHDDQRPSLRYRSEYPYDTSRPLYDRKSREVHTDVESTAISVSQSNV
ncbi:MAG: hypothetical protein SVY53_15590 [Chloroflexota bacterium]|nr:hypothetical protein [Chloroflexota bacterium]